MVGPFMKYQICIRLKKRQQKVTPLICKLVRIQNWSHFFLDLTRDIKDNYTQIRGRSVESNQQLCFECVSVCVCVCDRLKSNISNQSNSIGPCASTNYNKLSNRPYIIFILFCLFFSPFSVVEFIDNKFIKADGTIVKSNRKEKEGKNCWFF